MAKERISFLNILANSGQSSGGHTALLIGDKVYHFQYNFNDKILYLIRDPWEEFRFHYSVWENRSISLIELGIPEQNKDEFKTHWDQTYLIQRKWIENLKEIKADADWIRYISSNDHQIESVYPVAGLGYFSDKISINDPIIELTPPEIQKISNELKVLNEKPLYLNRIKEQNEQALTNTFQNKKFQSSFLPPIRYHSLFKDWENQEQKKFVREYLITPMAFQEEAFIFLQGNEEFKLADEEKLHLEKLQIDLEEKLRSCISEIDRCNGTEEIVLLVRIFSIQSSLKNGYYVVPKKANYDPFYYEELKEIPSGILDEKRKESIRLFQIAKKHFFEGGGELAFREWEKEIAKVDSLQRQKLDITHFEAFPSKKGDRTFRISNEMREWDNETYEKSKIQFEGYTELVQNIYPYHIILQNCTGEIFRYQNQFFPDENRRNDILGGTVSEKTRSLSFIPFVAAIQVKSNYKIIQEKNLLSYRLQKKNEKKLSFLANLKEDMVPFSSYYLKNPYDQDFLFFTDDTLFLRPMYGITNVIWGIGSTTAGIFTSPWDKGKKFTNGIRSVFFSFPELVFMNIRKGYFPYITQKDLPESYYNRIYE